MIYFLLIATLLLSKLPASGGVTFKTLSTTNTSLSIGFERVQTEEERRTSFIQIEMFDLLATQRVYKRQHTGGPTDGIFTIANLQPNTTYAIAITGRVSQPTQHSIQQNFLARTKDTNGKDTLEDGYASVVGLKLDENRTRVLVEVEPAVMFRQLNMLVTAEVKCRGEDDSMNKVQKTGSRNKDSNSFRIPFDIDVSKIVSNLSACEMLCLHPFIKMTPPPSLKDAISNNAASIFFTVPMQCETMEALDHLVLLESNSTDYEKSYGKTPHFEITWVFFLLLCICIIS